jgi:hypothetical protein
MCYSVTNSGRVRARGGGDGYSATLSPRGGE